MQNASVNVSFTASADSNPTPTEQWQVSTDGGKTFTNISGATATTLTLTDVTTSMSGYEYQAVFTNSFGSVTSNAATLTVNPDPTATVVSNATATFNAAAQNVALSANVTSGAGAVNDGTVTFTLLQGSQVIGTATTSSTVNNGQASVNYTLPASTTAGTYTIQAVYNPGSGSDFATSSDNSHTLTVHPGASTTTAPNATASFSSSSQTVTLTANVSSGAGAVNEGTVTFTLLQGSTLIGTATTSGTVSNGQASVNYALPANLASGSYTIKAVYNPGPDFTTSSDNTHTLAITPDHVATTANSVVSLYSSNPVRVSLSATVADTTYPSITVNEGVVTFTLKNGLAPIGTSVQAAVSNGQASAGFTLPAGLHPGTYTVAVSYSDSQGNFSDQGDTSAPLTVQLAPTVTTNPANQTVTAGTTATFTAAADGYPAPTVQWQVSSDRGQSWNNINGATSPTLTLSNVPFSFTGNEYRAVFSSSLGTATTTAATLIVQTVPALTSGNTATFTVGQGSNFLVTATGSPTPSLTEVGALPTGVTFTDNENGTATLAGTPAAGTNGFYSFTITAHNGVGNDAVQSFLLAVNTAPTVTPPTVTSSSTPSSSSPVLKPPLALAFFDMWFGGIEAINANGTETVTDSWFGIPLLISTYDGSGNLVRVDFLGLDVTSLFV